MTFAAAGTGRPANNRRRRPQMISFRARVIRRELDHFRAHSSAHKRARERASCKFATRAADQNTSRAGQIATCFQISFCSSPSSRALYFIFRPRRLTTTQAFVAALAPCAIRHSCLRERAKNSPEDGARPAPSAATLVGRAGASSALSSWARLALERAPAGGLIDLRTLAALGSRVGDGGGRAGPKPRGRPASGRHSLMSFAT